MSLIRECKAGFFERPERIVLMIIGALANKMAPALWLLAIGPNITVIHRIVHTWREMQAGRLVEIVPVEAPPASATVQNAEESTATAAGKSERSHLAEPVPRES